MCWEVRDLGHLIIGWWGWRRLSQRRRRDELSLRDEALARRDSEHDGTYTRCPATAAEGGGTEDGIEAPPGVAGLGADTG